MKNIEVITLEEIQKAYRKAGPFISKPVSHTPKISMESIREMVVFAKTNGIPPKIIDGVAYYEIRMLLDATPEETPSLVAAPKILKALQHVAKYLDELSENYGTGCAPPGLTCAKQHVNEALLWLFT